MKAGNSVFAQVAGYHETELRGRLIVLDKLKNIKVIVWNLIKLIWGYMWIGKQPGGSSYQNCFHKVTRQGNLATTYLKD